MPAEVPALMGLKQKDLESGASLRVTVRPCIQINNENGVTCASPNASSEFMRKWFLVTVPWH